jgi:hypothetical protein
MPKNKTYRFSVWSEINTQESSSFFKIQPALRCDFQKYIFLFERVNSFTQIQNTILGNYKIATKFVLVRKYLIWFDPLKLC